MREPSKLEAIWELMTIPGVGKSIASDLWGIGIRQVADLKGAEPEDLWMRINMHCGGPTCRCVLYTMRCAVYYASNETHDPERLKWWNWKD